jgi:hypothetical protein
MIMMMVMVIITMATTQHLIQHLLRLSQVHLLHLQFLVDLPAYEDNNAIPALAAANQQFLVDLPAYEDNNAIPSLAAANQHLSQVHLLRLSQVQLLRLSQVHLLHLQHLHPHLLLVLTTLRHRCNAKGQAEFAVV